MAAARPRGLRRESCGVRRAPSRDRPGIRACVYADFSGQGKNYTQFPDRQTFRIYLEDLRSKDVRDRLRNIWLDPASLDPTQQSAKVTRDIAKRLAQVSLALEKKKHPAQDVAMFLMRCLFTMFAEDVGLLPEKSFKEVLEECEKNLGILSSRTHVVWSLRAGGWLGVGNDPRYSKSRCFDPFPFPDANNIQKQTIRLIAEELDAHRKRALAEHPHLTLTGLYNALEKLRSGTKPDDLDEHDRKIFDDGLVLIMKELHDRLDIAVAEAYGWPVDLSDDEILARLVALNKERSDEEKRGLVRWLRPDYQIPRFAKGVDKQAAKEAGAQVAAELIAAVEQKPSFPIGAVEQTAAVFSALAAARQPLDAKSLAAQFKRTKTTEKKVGDVLASLARLGYVTSEDGKTFALRRVA
jgi:hypothetical protein